MEQGPEPQCFLAIANDVPVTATHTVSASAIAEALLERGFWAISAAAPHQSRMRKHDTMLFYLAGAGRRHFVAVATIVDSPRGPLAAETAVLRGLGVSFFPRVIPLDSVRWLDPPVPIVGLLGQLEFIKDKQNYGLHLRAPIVRVGWEDARAIVGDALAGPGH